MNITQKKKNWYQLLGRCRWWCLGVKLLQIRTGRLSSACGGTGRLSAFAIVTTRGLNTPSRVRLMTSRNPSNPQRLSSSHAAKTISHPFSLNHYTFPHHHHHHIYSNVPISPCCCSTMDINCGCWVYAADIFIRRLDRRHRVWVCIYVCIYI